MDELGGDDELTDRIKVFDFFLCVTALGRERVGVCVWGG